MSITATLLETLDVFGLDAVQKTKKTQNNVKELSGSPGKRSFEHCRVAYEIFTESAFILLRYILKKCMQKDFGNDCLKT